MRYKLTYNENMKHLHILKEGDDMADYEAITDWLPVEVLDEFKREMNTFYPGLDVCSPVTAPSSSEMKMRWNEFMKRSDKNNA
ncbi:hypothetical protein [Rufibacter roseus]|uniref:Uncharacterized protein n=1 Tax=Rufibacter roseus TaxID=1567108 RepID=A0ABW2DNM9_9BACT|nr:hypothetical protein [Rufibacter roseus]